VTAALEARGLAVTIAGKTVCRSLDLALAPGQCWALLGVNGVGKTTLLHTLGGLRPPAGGEVRLLGQPLAHLPRRAIARRLGLVLQAPSDTFPATVLDTALIGRHPHLGPWGWETQADRQQARGALATVGLAGLEGRDVVSLSGGERRRLAIATWLTQDPLVGLLDEPLSHLDLAHQVRLMAHLAGLAREGGKALLMALHDVNLAARFCDHALLLLGEGEALAGPAGTVLLREHLQRAYGYPLLELATPHGAAWLPD
jgi:iron complex transport system ATP-binding protein